MVFHRASESASAEWVQVPTAMKRMAGSSGHKVRHSAIPLSATWAQCQRSFSSFLDHWKAEISLPIWCSFFSMGLWSDCYCHRLLCAMLAVRLQKAALVAAKEAMRTPVENPVAQHISGHGKPGGCDGSGWEQGCCLAIPEQTWRALGSHRWPVELLPFLKDNLSHDLFFSPPRHEWLSFWIVELPPNQTAANPAKPTPFSLPICLMPAVILSGVPQIKMSLVPMTWILWLFSRSYPVWVCSWWFWLADVDSLEVQLKLWKPQCSVIVTAFHKEDDILGA